MTNFTVYSSAAFAPWQASLQRLLDGTLYTIEWKNITTLQECPVGAFVLLAEQDMSELDLPLLGARNVLMLADNWHFNDALKWLAQGAKDSAAMMDVSRIAAWLAAELSHSMLRPTSHLDAEVMLQTVIDAIPVPIFYKDELHIYRGCNQAFCRFLGKPVDKVVGHSVYDIAPKEMADIYYQADEALLAEGGTQVYEAVVVNAQGERNEIEFSKAVFYKPNGQKGGQVGAMLDVTERNRLLHKLEKASSTDPLTGIGNRREFNLKVIAGLKEAIERCHHMSLLTLDIDYFKRVNDEFGHAEGDEALKFFVTCVQQRLPKQASIYRIGGEEFYVLLEDHELAYARTVAEDIRWYLPTQPLVLKGQQVRLTVSIGVIQLANEDLLDESFRRVDQALYQAKNSGRNRVCLAYYDS